MIISPRVAINTDTEINKALIELSRVLNAEFDLVRGEFAAADGALSLRIDQNASDIDLLARGLKVGGDIEYGGAADTHTIQPMVAGIWYQGTAPGAIMRRYIVNVPQTSITSAMTGYPAANAWAYVTCDYLGTIRLRAAAGGLTGRPTNSYYQLSSAGIGYNDIDRFGYYYTDGERIIGAIGKVSGTEFFYIHNEAEEYEHGEYQLVLAGSVTLGVQTYTKRRGVYKRTPHIAQATGDVAITAKDPAIAGNVVVNMPFASVNPPAAPAGIRYPGQVSYASGFTYAGRTWLALTHSAPGSAYTLIANGSALGSAAVTVANMAAASELTFALEFDIG